MAFGNYKRIKDIALNDWNINIFGIVKYFRPPTKITKTGDHHLVITVIDESLGNNVEQGIRCNIFHPDEDQLPKVTKIGDIILLKYMKVKLFSGRLQAQRTNEFQWSVFVTAENVKKVQYVKSKMSSKPEPRISNFENQRLRELLGALKNIRTLIIESEAPQKAEVDNITLLSDIKGNTFVNVVVQVLSIDEVIPVNSNALILTVSDGSRVRFDSLLHLERETRVLHEVEEATVGYKCEVSVFDEHAEDARKIKVGSFIKITNLHSKSVSMSFHNKFQRSPKSNVQSQHPDQCLELVVHTGRKYNRGIQVQDVGDPRVDEVRALLLEAVAMWQNCTICIRDIVDSIDLEIASENNNDNHEIGNSQEKPTISSGIQKGTSSIQKGTSSIQKGTSSFQKGTSSLPRCLQQSLTTVDFPLHPVSSIADTHQANKQQLTSNKFHLRVKALTIRPNALTHMIYTKCSKCAAVCKPYVNGEVAGIPTRCYSCNDTNLPNLDYFFRILVEDDTGLLEVFACGTNALYFFNAMSPSVLMADEALRSNMEEKLKLFDNNNKEDLNDGTIPYIDICVIPKLVSGVGRYFMFGTSLI